MRVLLLGGSGLVGTAVRSVALARGVMIVAPGHADLDIRDEVQARRWLTDARPDVVINSAAVSRIDQCELQPLETQTINADAPALWSRLCRQAGVRLCQLSSDQALGAHSAYARQKAQAERAVLAEPGHLVARLAWVFGKGGATFVSQIPARLLELDVLEVLQGRTGSCVHAAEAARILLDLLETGATGLHHAVHPGEVTWPGFAHEARRQLLRRGSPVRARIVERPLDQAGLAAARVAYSTLDVTETERAIGRAIPPWPRGLAAYLDELWPAGANPTVPA